MNGLKVLLKHGFSVLQKLKIVSEWKQFCLLFLKVSIQCLMAGFSELLTFGGIQISLKFPLYRCLLIGSVREK